MNNPQPLILTFEHSLRQENWQTRLPALPDDGFNKWKSAVHPLPVITCHGTDAVAFKRVQQEIEAHSVSGSKIFAVGKAPSEIAFFHRLKTKLPSLPWCIIALRAPNGANSDPLEQAGADYVVSNLSESAMLIQTPPISASLSVVLLAYNEADVLEKSVNDVHRFCRQYAPAYEIIIVDDGSSDSTEVLCSRLAGKNVRTIRHSKNMGMGASMRDGYREARCDYVVSLPGDRQVRAHSLVAFLPHIAPNTVVLSQYPVPHSGKRRAVMSTIFRQLVRHVGGLRVDVAGAYLFSTQLFNAAPVSAIVASNTFLYSFQLLESFKKHGAIFVVVDAVPFPREVGQSREARPGRIAKMAGELLRHRALSAVHRRFRCR
ncbi:MAG: glycosyltransferase family 2 protein [Deltaproteobacteria bacterium]|nr:glycosyltransferase family 2 protein [Deltaproteobacteria bacterium]